MFSERTSVGLDVHARSVVACATLEWVHYGKKNEGTATEVGQYWESSHADTPGNLRGATPKDGAVCFGRVVDGAGLGSFTAGRGGKETRVSFNLGEFANVINRSSSFDAQPGRAADSFPTSAATNAEPSAASTAQVSALPSSRTVSASASPNVHVNVEIHIAADATADTVREIFRNLETANNARFAQSKTYHHIAKKNDPLSVNDKNLPLLCEDAGVFHRNARSLLGDKLDTRNRCSHPTGYVIGRGEAAVFIGNLIINFINDAMMDWI